MPFLIFIVAVVLTILLIPPLISVAGRIGAVDYPDVRKVHAMPVPRIGGLGMIVGALVPILAWLSLDDRVVSFLAGAVIIAVFGLWDDRADLDYRIKFLGQLAAVLLPVLFGGVVISHVPFVDTELPGWIAIPLTIVLLVGVTNAINLSDGLDGLAAGLSLVSLAAIALLAYMAGGHVLLGVTLAIAGCVFGFLRYNTHPASVFMGDIGSQFLGFSVGVLAVLLTQVVNPALSPLLILLLLGLPVLDTLTVMFQRLREGRSPFTPDKNHLHHRLLAAGLHHYEAVTLIYLFQGAYVASAYFLRYESDILLMGVYSAISAMVLLTPSFLGGRRQAERDSVAVGNTGLLRLLVAIRNHSLFKKLPLAVVELSVPLYLAYGLAQIETVPKDFSLFAMVGAVLLMLRMIFGYRLWFLFLRLFIFVTIAFVVYLSEMYPSFGGGWHFWLEVVFFSSVVIALLLCIRYGAVGYFKVTPTDMLVALGILAMAALPQDLLQELHLVPMMLKGVILFYASEVGMKAMHHRWGILPSSVLAALVMLAVRGLF